MAKLSISGTIFRLLALRLLPALANQACAGGQGQCLFSEEETVAASSLLQTGRTGGTTLQSFEQRATISTAEHMDISLLRIQKTGGTTFGEDILPKMCQKKSKACQGTYHLDWNLVLGSSSIVTMLRHPVERMLSEFQFLRDNKELFDQSQWDFGSAAKEEIWMAIVNQNLTGYLNIMRNPSLNRQTLYLAGFKPDNSIHLSGGTVTLEDGIHWNINGPEILERAKAHLSSDKVSIGIHDRFECSMKLFSKTYGWPVDEVLDRVRTVHAREQSKETERILALLARTSSRKEDIDNDTLWSETIDEEARKQIEHVSAFDMQLYTYAEELFRERSNGIC